MIKNKKLQEIDLSLNSLVVFRKLMTQEVILPLRGLLDTETMDPVIQLRLYTEFISRLYTQSTNLTEYIFRLICEDENFYITAKARGDEVDPLLESCVENELAILQRLARLRSHELQREVSYYGVLPEWKTSDINFYEAYMERVRNIGKYGYGKFARHAMFVLREGRCVPVLHPDPIRMDDLIGYEAERSAVRENTLALLSGKPAQNVLLSGDAGTGKSSTVKALVNEYFSEGLRLIQITKEQLTQLPELTEQIYDNPLKFILFIDDLSFSADDNSFGTLKATLEGTVTARAKNAVIYATSNRRQIVRERYSDRTGDDRYRHDTVQEIGSVAARFGLRINFSEPDLPDYLALVSAIAQQRGLDMDDDLLAAEAERFAEGVGGRSPRAAKQLVEQLLIQQQTSCPEVTT